LLSNHDDLLMKDKAATPNRPAWHKARHTLLVFGIQLNPIQVSSPPTPHSQAQACRTTTKARQLKSRFNSAAIYAN